MKKHHDIVVKKCLDLQLNVVESEIKYNVDPIDGKVCAVSVSAECK